MTEEEWEAIAERAEMVRCDYTAQDSGKLTEVERQILVAGMKRALTALGVRELVEAAEGVSSAAKHIAERDLAAWDVDASQQMAELRTALARTRGKG